MRPMFLRLAACLVLVNPLQNGGDEQRQPGQSPQGEETSALRGPNERKRQQLLEIHQRFLDSSAPFFGGKWVPRLQAQLDTLPQDASPEELWDVSRTLADWLLREGQVDEAIRVLNRLVQSFQSSGREGGAPLPLLKQLAVAHLRRAEQANCVCQQNGESCIFPLRDAAQHTQREGAAEAARLLEKALLIQPGDLQSIWLLNLCHMALGSYPEEVSTLYRIPPERIESEFDIGKFEDIAPRLGMNRRTCAGGAVMDDFDGDGDLDVITSSMETSTPLAYYRNQGDGSFLDVSAQTGLASQLGGLNFVHGDVDGDGRLDLYIPRGAWLYNAGEIPHSLMLQQEDGTFLDVTRRAGLEIAEPSQVAALDDIDSDGDLDLFVGGESTRTRTGWSYTSHLYVNDGKGRFDEITSKAGVENLAYCKGAAFGDYDADGFTDLYVSNLNGPNRLYHNQGNRRFVDVAEELGVAEPITSFATWWFDANNDGWLDLFVTNYEGRDRSEQVAAYYKYRTTGLDSARLYLNQEGKGFRDVSFEMHLNRPFFPMGANFGDLDSDGYPDLYFGTGDPEFSSLWPNIALRNDPVHGFQDVTTSGGLGHLQKGHGVAFGDIDQDGDQDLFVQMGGAYRDDAFYDVLFRNPGHGHHWITVRPRGVQANRFAVGARLRVRIEEEGGERDVYTWVGSGGSFGGNSLQAEIGLGDARRIVALEVRWPRSGLVQVFENVPLDSTIAVTEGEKDFVLVPAPPIGL